MDSNNTCDMTIDNTTDNCDVSRQIIEMARKQQQMQEEGVKAYIEGISEKLLRVDSWETFNAGEIAESSLQVAVKGNGFLAGDDQTHRFRHFLSIATNFSSLPFAEKLLKIPELVESIKQLIESMIKEVQEYSDMANELRDLIQCFIRMVMQVKHNVNMMLPLLTAATSQLLVVEDVMNTDPTQALNETDKKDVKLALDRMSTGIQNLLSIAKSSKTESQKLDDRIHNMTGSVQSKKMIVKERLEIAEFCFKHSVKAGAVGGAAAAGGCVVAETFGGVGALVIAGTAFPPVGAIVSAFILGGICAATATVLVKKFWVRYQHKALSYLEKIFEGLVHLNSANMNFMRYMTDTEEKANTVSQHLQDIQLCLKSERQRRVNRDVCTRTIKSTNAMIESLNQISAIDTQRTDTTTMLNFSKTKTVTNAITN
ncbi:unnamed protein product [Didymodactylos carnosus]|uniref:Uncharacterized protein n=1 Tax=Didymodactylos carnosus TaxID=1234261 RepID=A0A815G6X0_9BILA|nr:unnamed protein product [Didymodactylos carnosus]CAF1334702.1 unnamed protein product [Didymodactylos carnosus]CAF3713685.1 unnamed protein product [Didymodactylos carnosus]CAF4190940.1 unnamed protein product [Didymodactylos carnosus]